MLDRLLAELRYVSGSLEDDEVYAQLQRTLGSIDEHAGRELNRVFVLATASEFFPLSCAKLGEAG